MAALVGSPSLYAAFTGGPVMVCSCRGVSLDTCMATATRRGVAKV